eukprot:CAMPEP_0113934512 /NCGR_PEP_ID=MMETSP1339-20121228/1839_1 /TAXON_ID=94617 /ORGANISM="Fibrocapsa japonica" /LENGTH=75 /DNA_ID=CAMNT_0000936353 /DNA_START=172 /DNA_END=399 /DNA_ORIENTATION=+ /assembly_acc=CAM_ASM_000762
MAKTALSQAGAKMVVHELNTMDNGGAVQSACAQISGIRTVPQVFIGGQFYADGSATRQKAESGELATALQEAGAV